MIIEGKQLRHYTVNASHPPTAHEVGRGHNYRHNRAHGIVTTSLRVAVDLIEEKYPGVKVISAFDQGEIDFIVDCRDL